MTRVHWKITLAVAVVLAPLGWLSYTGIRDSASYYLTISQLKQVKPGSRRQFRVAGIVVPGSIQRHAGSMDFELKQGNLILPVIYVGTSPVPDTFIANAQALAEGRLLPDGHFQATGIQAKCPSKYKAKSYGKPASSM